MTVTEKSTTTSVPKTNGKEKEKPAGKAADIKVEFKAPTGFVDQTQDVVGFYEPSIEPIIKFIPIEAVLSDSQLDDSKVSILIFGKLTDPCRLVETSKSGNVVEGKKGDMVGIWGKPGMRSLRTLAGEATIMFPDGKLDTGKINAMTVYRVLAQKKGGVLPIVEDRREKSRSATTWLDVRKGDDGAF
jgi:hypothetical protein